MGLCCNRGPRRRENKSVLRDVAMMKLKFDKIHNGVVFDGTNEDGLEDTTEPVAMQVKHKTSGKKSEAKSEHFEEPLNLEDVKMKVEFYKHK